MGKILASRLQLRRILWKTHGFPPYHYQCRTSIRGVWARQLDGRGGPDSDADLARFKPMDGFGGDPLADGTWWDQTESQRRQAERLGVQGLIDAARGELVGGGKDAPSHAPKVVDPGKHFDRKERTYTDAEDLAAVNPNFATGSYEYATNCQRCVATWEMRRRGYRVTALPATDPDELAHNWTGIFRGMRQTKCRTKDEAAEIRRQMEQWGDGARAEVFVQWNDAEAHVFVAEQKNGRTYFYDPQNTKRKPETYFANCIKGLTTLARIDTLEVTELILQCCTNQ